LRVLLRSALARLLEPRTRARFRDADIPQAGTGAPAPAGDRLAVVRLQANQSRCQYRSVPRAILEVLLGHHPPVTIVTKGSLILRDLDLLARLASRRLTSVVVSLTTLDESLKRVLEPRAASPQARLRVMRELADAGVPVTAMLAPVIPALTDHEIESLLDAAAGAGVRHAGYMLLRLPGELGPLFEQWLQDHRPEAAGRVLGRLRDMRGGRLNDPRFGHRMRGGGAYAGLIGARFAATCRRLGLNAARGPELDCSQFARDPAAPRQRDFFS